MFALNGKSYNVWFFFLNTVNADFVVLFLFFFVNNHALHKIDIYCIFNGLWTYRSKIDKRNLFGPYVISIFL